MKKLFPLIMLAIIVVITYGCGGDDGDGPTDPPPVPEPRVVVATHQDPGLASVDHAVWDSISAVSVPLGTDADYNSGVAVHASLNANMKALKTASNLYIRIEWADNDKDTRFGEYRSRWLNNRNNWEAVDTTLFSNEDRFYVLFDQGGTNGADCATMCHAVANGSGRKFYGAAGDDADVWHWKATRTGLGGFAEDLRITSSTILPDPQDGVNDSLCFRNWYSIGGHPAKMHPDTTEWTGDALLEGTYMTFDNDLDWVEGLPGDSVSKFHPGYYFNHMSSSDGSRWDVQVLQEHDGTNWTVVFRRALNTTDLDDINLTSADSVSVSVAVGDNNGMKHWGRAPFYLVFE